MGIFNLAQIQNYPYSPTECICILFKYRNKFQNLSQHIDSDGMKFR